MAFAHFRIYRFGLGLDKTALYLALLRRPHIGWLWLFYRVARLEQRYPWPRLMLQGFCLINISATAVESVVMLYPITSYQISLINLQLNNKVLVICYVH